MTLYHYSEDPTIEVFVPRAPLAHPQSEPFVYAIDAWHSPLYYLPRDCPRVCFWPLPSTTPEDRELFFNSVSGRMVIAIEAGWYASAISTQLYCYTFLETHFVSTHDHGVHLSRETISPLGIEPVGNLIERLLESDVELRLCPSLVPIGERIIQSSLHFSLIRMRNAQGWRGAPGSPVTLKEEGT